MIALIVPIIVMLLVVIGEAAVLRWIEKQPVNWHDVVFNLNSGHIMLWLFRGLEVFCYGFVATHFSLNWVSHWPAPLLWLFALLAWDFGFYWLHRLHHKIAALWAVHVVHHQGEHFNLSLGVRNSWYSSLTSIPFFLLLAVMGVPLSVFITVSLIHYTIQLFNHNALTPKLGWLEKVIVTPAHHRIHHVNDRFYSDKNFGGSFIFWDKLFGTFWHQLPQQSFRYGAGREPPSLNPFWASNLPLIRFLKLPFRYAARPPVFHFAPRSLFCGAMLLFMLVIGYIYRYGYGYPQVDTGQTVMFLLLAAGSIALGGLAEGKHWGVLAWLFITLALPAIFIGLLHWQERFWLIMLPLVALHGLSVALGWGRRPLGVRALADG